MASSPTTALRLITGALVALQVLDPAEVPNASQGQQGLRSLNDLIGQWSLQGLTIPYISRTVQALTANKGSVSNPYTVGSGGNIDIERPTDLAGIGLILNASSPTVEVPKTLLDATQWQNIFVKDLTAAQFTAAFYNPTVASNLGTLYLWPVPDNAVNSMALYIAESLGEFTALAASYYLPNGYGSALKFQLALEIADDYGRPITPNLERMAARSFANIKRQNITLTDMANDFAYIGTNLPAYDINTGNL